MLNLETWIFRQYGDMFEWLMMGFLLLKGEMTEFGNMNYTEL
jgi:hypothetical protein